MTSTPGDRRIRDISPILPYLLNWAYRTPGRRWTPTTKEAFIAGWQAHAEHTGQTGWLADVAERSIRTGALTIDGSQGRVYLGCRELDLTPIERGLLLYLAQKMGRLCWQSELLHHVWGPDYEPSTGLYAYPQACSEGHVIRVHMARLRGKLGASRDLIQTVKGYGYQLVDAEAVEVEP